MIPAWGIAQQIQTSKGGPSLEGDTPAGPKGAPVAWMSRAAEKWEVEEEKDRSTARRLGPAASSNGEHKSGVAPRAFWCPASLGPVGVPTAALGFVVVAIVVVVVVRRRRRRLRLRRRRRRRRRHRRRRRRRMRVGVVRVSENVYRSTHVLAQCNFPEGKHIRVLAFTHWHARCTGNAPRLSAVLGAPSQS